MPDLNESTSSIRQHDGPGEPLLPPNNSRCVVCGTPMVAPGSNLCMSCGNPQRKGQS